MIFNYIYFIYFICLSNFIYFEVFEISSLKLRCKQFDVQLLLLLATINFLAEIWKVPKKKIEIAICSLQLKDSIQIEN